MSRFLSTTPISPGTSLSGGVRRPSGFDPGGFSSMGQDRSKPEFLTPAKGIEPPAQGGGITNFGNVPTGLLPPSQMTPTFSSAVDIDKIIQDAMTSSNLQNAVDNTFSGSGGMGAGTPSKAQSILGPAYAEAIALGMTPSEIDAQLNRALAEGRGINIEKFQQDLDKFRQFQESDFAQGTSGKLPVIDGQNVMSVSPLQITANPAEGVMGLVGSLGGPFVDMFADALGAAAQGDIGTMAFVKDIMDKGKGFSFGKLFNPGDIAGRLEAAGPEAKRIYREKMMQGMPYQQAFEEATGEKFSTGGIATLQ